LYHLKNSARTSCLKALLALAVTGDTILKAYSKAWYRFIGQAKAGKR
jgi:hypothetical protein